MIPGILTILGLLPLWEKLTGLGVVAAAILVAIYFGFQYSHSLHGFLAVSVIQFGVGVCAGLYLANRGLNLSLKQAAVPVNPTSR